MFKVSLLCLILYGLHLCEGYKVLVIFALPAHSHGNLGEGLVRHLLEAGHEVTYITPFPKNQKKYPLLRELDTSFLQDAIPRDLFNIETIMKKDAEVQSVRALMSLFMDIQMKTVSHGPVSKLLNDPKEHFDVVIAEWMFTEFISGYAPVFNCPLIWVSSIDPHWMILKLIDEITNPAYTADAMSSGTVPFTFTQRVSQLFNIVMGLALQNFYIDGIEREAYEQLFVPIIKKKGYKVPDLDELRYNASLILGNSHVSMGHPIRLPQNYKAIGGYHIDTNVKPLPEDLKKILDNAKNGLIYFSMGSNLRSKYMPAELKASLLKMFGTLKQTVLWKFEEDLPNRPENVHILKWAPQHGILAHPNCVLFITHGGLLSTTETIHFGKPIIGIPVFGDQFNNVDRAVLKGFAKRVDLSLTMADELKKAINDIVSDPSYTAKVKMLSLIYHDRPVTPGKELVHWVEHVVRTGGAPHLRSPALLVPWYQKCYLDLAALIIVVWFALKLLFTKLIQLLFSKSEHKKKMQ